MDKLIGRLLDKARLLGIEQNTWFIFCSDNGTAVTAKDRGVERGVHVPYVVMGPGVKRRGPVDALTDFADVAPTLLDIAGIEAPKDAKFDGTSQLPFLKGESEALRDWIYGYTGPVQVFRTADYLLEARAPFYDKPQGRLYHTGKNRFGRNYTRIQKNPEHAEVWSLFERLVNSQPSHLEADHKFWSSKLGRRWLTKNDKQENAKKQLYNHPDYIRYDQKD
jgi:arylsulfatase A-like enzyme